MDKEDCIQALLSTLQKPEWKCSTSVTDGDLKSILWKAGLLLTPEQVAGLLADMKRRGLIAGAERRSRERIVAMWGVRITASGDEWLAQRAVAPMAAARRPHRSASAPSEARHPEGAADSGEHRIPGDDSRALDHVPPGVQPRDILTPNLSPQARATPGNEEEYGKSAHGPAGP